MIPIRKKFFDQKNLLLAASIALLGFGRASASVFLSPLTAVIGYACAFGALAAFPPGKKRFFAGWALFALVILLQSSWFLSHPYSYIIAIWILLSVLFAIPYACLSLLVTSNHRHTLLSSAGLAAAFALLEYGFTCLPCGYSFQSAALHLSWCLWPLQLASIVGGIGLSFFVFWCNIVVFYWLFSKAQRFALPAALIASLPYLIGGALYWHRTDAQQTFDQTHPSRQVAFCHMEEPPDVYSHALSPEALHEQEWQKILELIDPHFLRHVDIIVLPEGVAPYSAESPLFLSSHLPVSWKNKYHGNHQFLSSLDLSRMISSSLKASVLIGLEGRSIDNTGNVLAHNSCFFISPSSSKIARYDKQLLLPLGEYIPFSILRSALATYGIHDSFSPGEGAVVFAEGSLRITPLICYEETFSRYAVATLPLQPNMIVSLSNDCWYPDIRREHAELARLRTAEMGLPMVRSCNQGVSCAVDALGRTIASRGEYAGEKSSCVACPLSQYTTFSLYALLGPAAIAVFCALVSAIAFWSSRRRP